MKLKDAARLSMLIEAEGCIRVYRPYTRHTENCLSSPHIGIEITNTDMGIINWSKSVLEKELGHSFRVYVHTPSPLKTRECYRLVVSKFEDVHKILNITRGLMVGVKKLIADLICSFLDYRNSIVKSNNYVHDPLYREAFNKLVNKVQKIQRTYNQIKPVTTGHSPDLNDQKVQSDLSSNAEKLAEMTNSSNDVTMCNT